MVNGLTGIALNHLDTIGKLDKAKMCVAYNVDGKLEEYYSSNLRFLKKAKTVYEEFEGNFDIAGLRDYDSLPPQAKAYVERIEDYTKTPVEFIGTGPGREDIIVRRKKILSLNK